MFISSQNRIKLKNYLLSKGVSEEEVNQKLNDMTERDVEELSSLRLCVVAAGMVA